MTTWACPAKIVDGEDFLRWHITTDGILDSTDDSPLDGPLLYLDFQ
jgi:hypothetical protein